MYNYRRKKSILAPTALIIITVFLVITFIRCSCGVGGNKKIKFSLTTKSLSLKAGELSRLEYKAENEEDMQLLSDNITFESSDSSVVHIDPVGNAVALKAGNATITASYGDVKKICEVKVEKKEPEKLSFTTAISANDNILNKNKSQGSQYYLYSIKVNKLKNCVTVYTYDKSGKYNVPVRAMICSCGKGDDTPSGEFIIGIKSEWLSLLGNVYGRYISQINGNVLFHSVPYLTNEDPSSVEVPEYNNLGKSVSMGCVRMAVSDAKWIYDNCIEGTPVKVYESENPGPLGRPEAMKNNVATPLHWDPTDNSKSNPYYNKKPKISGAENVSVPLGEEFSPLSGVTAYDTTGSDITKKITVQGEVNANKAGEYLLIYSVKDAMYRSCTKYRYITVK